MLVDIAIAKDGFIDCVDTPNIAQEDINNFEKCIKGMFIFEQRDLLEFDGNRCQMINSYNPENSIFFYENQQGKFLYTITSATPRIHKNNFIWDCLCYKMEDMAKIDEILGNNKLALCNVYKNIAPTISYGSARTNKEEAPDFAVKVKDNFQVKNTIKLDISAYDSDLIWCYKIKFLTLPNDLKTQYPNIETYNKEEDGSFNFFFPFRIQKTTSPQQDLPLLATTNGLRLVDGGLDNPPIKIKDVLEKYAVNIKTIEFIPFFPYRDDILGATIGVSPDWTNYQLAITIPQGSKAIYTDAGIFFPYGHTSKESQYNALHTMNYAEEIDFRYLSKVLSGGGAQGWVKMPLGNFPIDFNPFYKADTPYVNLYIKSDGWRIGGAMNCDILPHFVNFYTNETSQFLQQNTITNAQELRQMQRDYQNEKEKAKTNLFGNLLSGTIGNLLSGNFFGMISGGIGQGIGYATQQINAERDFNLAKTNFNDKIATQELIASTTGKEISGNTGASDFIYNLVKNNFLIIIETNFRQFSITKQGNPRTFIVPARDYDYSTVYTQNKDIDYEYNKYDLILDRRTDPDAPDVGRSVYNIYSLLVFLLGFESTPVGGAIGYYDPDGLNYDVVFDLQNLVDDYYASAQVNLLCSEKLKFSIRHKTKFG